MNEDMIGLVPAAGKGLRLGLPYPKELYPLIRDNHYRPVAQYVVENLTIAQVPHMVFVINETKHQILGYFGDGHRFGVDISYVVQEPSNENGTSTSPGLAHALDSAYHLTRGKTVFFGMADTIMLPSDVFRRAYCEMRPDDDAVLALFETSRPEKFGMVRLDANSRVLEIVDKPRKTDLTEMWGCIVWRASFTEYLHACLEKHAIRDFARIMNSAIDAGLNLRGARMPNSTYVDLGTYEEIAEMDQRLREEQPAVMLTGAHPLRLPGVSPLPGIPNVQEP